MSYRVEIENLSTDERARLAALIRQFLTQAVIDRHMKVDHMHRFFTHHRAYIYGLERFIKDQAGDAGFVRKVTPLPFWRPDHPLPTCFDAFEGRRAVAENQRQPLPALPAPPAAPTPPRPLSSFAEKQAYARAMQAYAGLLEEWNRSVHDTLICDSPVTDTSYLNTAYTGKTLPRELEHPENFDTPDNLADALGRDIAEGLFHTATHYHGATHASLAGLDNPLNLQEVVNLVNGVPPARPFVIGPFLNMRNTAAPFIFWPLHAYFELLYYNWEIGRLSAVQSPAIINNIKRGKNLELSVVGKDGVIWHTCHGSSEQDDGPTCPGMDHTEGPNTDNGSFGDWEHWHRIGDAQRVKKLANVRTPAGRLDVFAIAEDGMSSLTHMWTLGTDCKNWSHWDNLGGGNKDVSAIAHPDGRLHVFAIQADDAIHHKAELAGGGWSQWEQMFDDGQQLASILDGEAADAHIHVFSLSNGFVFHRWQTGVQGAWSGPVPSLLGDWSQKFTQIAVTSNQDHRVEVFAIGQDGKVYHNWQWTAGANHNFSGWKLLEGSNHCTCLTVGRNQDGRLEVFFGTGPEFYHSWQVNPNDVFVDAPSAIPLEAPMGWLRQPFTANDAEGRLMVFGVAADGLLWHAWQNAPNVGPWLGWLVV